MAARAGVGAPRATTVSGSFVPIAGDFNGDGYGDITWYAAGTAQDYVSHSSATGFTSNAVSVRGTYAPTAGDFNGDGYDDILFYGRGCPTPNTMVFGSPAGAVRCRRSSSAARLGDAEAEHPQRDSNPCRHLERVVS